MPKKIVGVEKFLLTLSIAGSLLVFFLLSPVIALFISIDPDTLSQTLYRDPVLANEFRRALLVTLEASVLSTSILLVLGIPLAYILARKRFWGREFIESLIDVPLMIPHAVAGVMVLVAYGRRGLLGPITSWLGLAVDDSFWGIVATMAFVSAPIMIDTLKIGFRSIDPMLEYIGRSLGASPYKVFQTITLPLALRSILSGAILSWARALSEVGAILIVAYYPKSINVLVIEWFSTYGIRYAVSISLVLALLSLAVFTLLRLVVEK